MLHKKDSRISSKLFKGGEIGTVTWNGNQPNILQLTGIPKSAKVAKGDSVVTSGYSTYFPKGIMVGIVTEVTPEKSTVPPNKKKDVTHKTSLFGIWGFISLQMDICRNFLELSLFLLPHFLMDHLQYAQVI